MILPRTWQPPGTRQAVPSRAARHFSRLSPCCRTPSRAAIDSGVRFSRNAQQAYCQCMSPTRRTALAVRDVLRLQEFDNRLDRPADTPHRLRAGLVRVRSGNSSIEIDDLLRAKHPWLRTADLDRVDCVLPRQLQMLREGSHPLGKLAPGQEIRNARSPLGDRMPGDLLERAIGGRLRRSQVLPHILRGDEAYRLAVHQVGGIPDHVFVKECRPRDREHVVRVHEPDDVTTRRLQPDIAGRVHTGVRLRQTADLKLTIVVAVAKGLSNRFRVVGRAIVDNHDFERPVALEAARLERLEDVRRRVIGGNDVGHEARCSGPEVPWRAPAVCTLSDHLGPLLCESRCPCDVVESPRRGMASPGYLPARSRRRTMRGRRRTGPAAGSAAVGQRSSDRAEWREA